MSARRRFLVALALSFAVHVAAVVSPAGWTLTLADEPEPAPVIEANLLVSAVSLGTRAPRRAGPRKAAAKPAPTLPQLPAVAATAQPDTVATPPAPPSQAEALAGSSGSGPGPVANAAPAAPTPAPIAPLPPAADGDGSADISLPRQGRIDFAISRGERGFVIGRSVHQWQHDGTTYSMTSINETTGLVALFRAARASLSSTGQIGADGLLPGEFRGDRGKAVDVAHFDWAAGKVTLSAGEPHQASLSPGSQDLLSMFYQLGISLHRGGIRDMAVATGRKFESYGFDTVGVERITLPFGVQRTLHLKTRTAPGEDGIEVWLGLDLSDLPLKIRYAERDGEVFYQVADKIEIGGQVIEKPEQRIGLGQ
jgi:hypothetical protein